MTTAFITELIRYISKPEPCMYNIIIWQKLNYLLEFDRVLVQDVNTISYKFAFKSPIFSIILMGFIVHCSDIRIKLHILFLLHNVEVEKFLEIQVLYFDVFESHKLGLFLKIILHKLELITSWCTIYYGLFLFVLVVIFCSYNILGFPIAYWNY